MFYMNISVSNFLTNWTQEVFRLTNLIFVVYNFNSSPWHGIRTQFCSQSLSKWSDLHKLFPLFLKISFIWSWNKCYLVTKPKPLLWLNKSHRCTQISSEGQFDKQHFTDINVMGKQIKREWGANMFNIKLVTSPRKWGIFVLITVHITYRGYRSMDLSPQSLCIIIVDVATICILEMF